MSRHVTVGWPETHDAEGRRGVALEGPGVVIRYRWPGWPQCPEHPGVDLRPFSTGYLACPVCEPVRLAGGSVTRMLYASSGCKPGRHLRYRT